MFLLSTLNSEAYQLTGFYMRATLALNGLKAVNFHKKKDLNPRR